MGTADSSIPFMLRLSLACKCDVYTIDYSKAPETKWPVPLQQVLSAWNYLLSTYKADKLCVAGDSAGGSLSVGLASFLQDHGGELPAGLALLCPWLDLGHSLPSNTLNQPHGTHPLLSSL